MNRPLLLAPALLLAGLLGAVHPSSARAEDTDTDTDSDASGDASERADTTSCDGRDGRDAVAGREAEDGAPGGDCRYERGDGLDDATG